MTLPDLLEELKVADPETYEEIVGWHQPRNQALDHLQGCIQRACERRGWEIDQNYRTRGRDGDLPQNMRHYAVVTSWDNDVHTYRGMGNSPAEALLMAYIAAVRGEAKR
jgi:hypothetical protein